MNTEYKIERRDDMDLIRGATRSSQNALFKYDVSISNNNLLISLRFRAFIGLSLIHI